MAVSGPRTESRRGELVKRMTAAIEPLLESTPYGDINVLELARAAGIARSTFYNHFSDKSDLLLAITETMAADLTGAAQRWFDLPVDAEYHDLRDVIRGIAHAYRDHRLLLKALVEGAAAEPAVRAAYDGLVATSARGIQQQIELGQAAGTIEPSVAPGPTARLLTLLGERSLYRYIACDDVRDDARFPDPLATLYWRVLYEGR